MGLVDYHVHTYLCGHATGTPDDYIERAISKGLLEIGFSDHAPLPENLREGITMPQSHVEYYISEIENRRERYSGEISIRIGLEVDFPLHNSFDKRFFSNNRLDYIIGSCHFLGDWIVDHPDYVDEFKNRDIDEVYSEYYKNVEELVVSRQFDILGHFDLVKKFGHRPTRNFDSIVENISKLIGRFDMTVEINTSGLRNPVREIYPSGRIIETLYNCNVPITLGSDSHSPDEIGYEFFHAIEEIRRLGYRKISGFSKRKRYDIGI
jgi:histidinol-phosphatase (PHP family)